MTGADRWTGAFRRRLKGLRGAADFGSSPTAVAGSPGAVSVGALAAEAAAANRSFKARRAAASAPSRIEAAVTKARSRPGELPRRTVVTTAPTPGQPRGAELLADRTRAAAERDARRRGGPLRRGPVGQRRVSWRPMRPSRARRSAAFRGSASRDFRAVSRRVPRASFASAHSRAWASGSRSQTGTSRPCARNEPAYREPSPRPSSPAADSRASAWSSRFSGSGRTQRRCAFSPARTQ